MEYDLLLDRNLSPEILALTDEQVQVLEEQIWDNGETPGDTIHIRVPEEQDGEELIKLIFEPQATPRPFFY